MTPSADRHAADRTPHYLGAARSAGRRLARRRRQEEGEEVTGRSVPGGAQRGAGLRAPHPSRSTIRKNENVLAPILTSTGARRLRELTAGAVCQALTAMAARYSTAAVAMGHNALTRAVRHAEAGIWPGATSLPSSTPPRGKRGGRARALALGQACALLAAAESPDARLYRPIAAGVNVVKLGDHGRAPRRGGWPASRRSPRPGDGGPRRASGTVRLRPPHIAHRGGGPGGWDRGGDGGQCQARPR
jgi:hypothetical protein